LKIFRPKRLITIATLEEVAVSRHRSRGRQVKGRADSAEVAWTDEIFPSDVLILIIGTSGIMLSFQVSPLNGSIRPPAADLNAGTARTRRTISKIEIEETVFRQVKMIKIHMVGENPVCRSRCSEWSNCRRLRAKRRAPTKRNDGKSNLRDDRNATQAEALAASVGAGCRIAGAHGSARVARRAGARPKRRVVCHGE